MANARTRRELANNSKTDFDMSLHFDVEQYLINTWPTLNATVRKSVHALASDDTYLAWDDIEDQLDEIVIQQIRHKDVKEEEDLAPVSDDESDLPDPETCVWQDIWDFVPDECDDDASAMELVEFVQENFDYTAVNDQIESLIQTWLNDQASTTDQPDA